jgi:hypothetical protein
MIPPSAIVTGAVNLPTARNSVPRSIHFLAVVPAPPIAVHRLNPGLPGKVKSSASRSASHGAVMTFQHMGRQTMQTPIDAGREARKPTESSRLAKAVALVAATTLATLAGAAIAGQPQGQMASDLATRDRDIHWPAGIEQGGPVR